MSKFKRIRLIIGVAYCFMPLASLATSVYDVQSAINNTPFYDPYDQCAITGPSTLTGKDNTMKVFNYLIPKGLTATQVAGIIGNLMAESNLNPAIQENGSTSPNPINGVGFGLAQWTFTIRQAPLVTLAKSENVAPSTLGVQLDYLWDELTNKAGASDYSFALTNLKKQTTVSGAAIQFMDDYEGPLVPNGGARAAFAQAAYTEYSQTNGGTSPGATAAPAGGCSSGTVVCNGGTGATSGGGISVTRQNVVCIAEQELKKWTSKQLLPANGYLKYSQGRPEEWCADFASWVYNQAKYPLEPDPNWNDPGVIDIEDIAKGILPQTGNKFTWHDVSGYTPKPGDFAIHEYGGDPDAHVNLVVAVAGNNMTLVGGDQGPGPYPGGSYVSSYPMPINQAASSDGIRGYVSPNN